MLKPEERMVIMSKLQEGVSKSEIARSLGVNWRTVQKVEKEGLVSSVPKTKRGSILDPYKDYIIARFDQGNGVTNCVKLLREIKERGYPGQISILRDFVLTLKKEHKHQAEIRFETVPGLQAQVDCGYVGFIAYGPTKRKLYCFTMVLGYSRTLYIEFTHDMSLMTLLTCHIHAFEYFKGVPKEILYDNMKQVVRYRDEEGRPHFHPQLLDFAHYYGFLPKVCAVRRPKTKGKVESGIGYVKGNFLQGEVFKGLGEANVRARFWLDNVANVRIHGTTGEIPFERLKEENLFPLPEKPYDTTERIKVRAGRDSLVSYKGNRYSVPYLYARKELLLCDDHQGELRIYCGNVLVCSHKLYSGRGKTILKPEHYPRRYIPKVSLSRYGGPRPIGEILRLVYPALVSIVEAPEVERRALVVYEEATREG